jgi:ACS family glucarate transporter-like MFS transporter
MSAFDVSATSMGTVYSAFILSYAATMIPAGWLADRVGPVPVLTAMGAGTGVLTLLTAGVGVSPFAALAGLVPSLIVLRLGLGVFASPLYPAGARAIAVATAPHERGRYQGLVIAGAPLGGAIAPVLFAPIIANYGWRAAFVVAGVATLFATVLWSTARPDASRNESIASVSDSLTPSTAGDQPNIWALAAGYFTINYFEYIFFYWIYYYFGVVRNVGRTESAVYTTALYVVMAAMMPLGGWLSDRLIPYWGVQGSRRRVGAGAMVFSAFLLYVGTSVTHEVTMVAVLALALGCVAGAEGPFWAAVTEGSRSHRPAVAGSIMNTVGNVGGFLAPILTPAIAVHFGWPASMHVASALILAGACTWLMVDRRPSAH